MDESKDKTFLNVGFLYTIAPASIMKSSKSYHVIFKYGVMSFTTVKISEYHVSVPSLNTA